MTGTIIELLLLLLAHTAAGIYSSTLKYSKKFTYIIWGIWIAFQTALLLCAEFVLIDWGLQFFVGFVLSLVGQYVIFFITTKGKLTQRIFTMLTYSVFFCIIMTPSVMIKEALGELHWSLTVIVQAILLFAIVTYFLRCVCPLCRTAAKNVTTGWAPLIFVNIVFIVTIILCSVFPVRLTRFDDPGFITFVYLSVSIFSVYPVIFSNINSLSEAAMKKAVDTQNKLLMAQIEAENAQLAIESHAKHDRRHHNLIMLEYANNNDFESVKEYLKNLVEIDNKASGEVRYCENRTINTIITVYEKRAKENGITVIVAAESSRELTVLPQDLVVVIANLFENAINATQKLKNRDKFIDIRIKESSKRLVIKFENPCKANYTFDESGFGVGISSVIATTKKYEGMYDFTAEDGIFSAKIILNLD